jgi:endonuclease-3 related protein
MGNQTISEILGKIYNKLWDEYGPQHWWPAREPFEVIVGAILTQTTAWSNVVKAIENLRSAGKLTPEALQSLSALELAELIRPCGYYNIKARRVKAFVDWLGKEYDGSLEKLFEDDIKDLRPRLLAVYGIGEETADSILLYAGEKPVFVIDAYTRRVIDRLGFSPDSHSYSAYQGLFMENLPTDVQLFNEYHALLVNLGKRVCRTKPLCQDCCLNPARGADKRFLTAQFPCSATRLP